MLENNAYDRWRKPLKEIIFSGMKVRPHAIMKKVFGITEKCDCQHFFLIGTNVAKGTETLWGKFYVLPSTKNLKNVIIIFEGFDEKLSQFKGVVEYLDWSEKNPEIIIRSLLKKDDVIVITTTDTKHHPGIISSKENLSGRRIARGHWEVLKKHFKKSNVNL